MGSNEKIEKTIAEFENISRDQLIPVLQKIQETQGYISKSAVQIIGKRLNIPASKIFGVATFYNQFRFQPLGKYHIQICRGTACHVKGSFGIMETLTQELKIKPGQTTRDGLFSLEVVACLGACSLAPVVNINGEFYANMSGPKLLALLKKLRAKEKSKEK
jgi:NADH-quinone oxidoreductase subunit E